ncbi:MAG: hypothetical protein ABJK83_00090, partial [Parasphingorhabdus sp.]|uniref:hypothetical protein n=1 Tax=Parasphingorhabdus sp. TaxID=2709688 RepID=UPI0032975033
PAGEPIWVISGRDSTEMIENTLFAAHIDKCDSSMWINSHKGKVDHARETYEKTGVMDVSIGDYFPRPVIEKETGKTWLINFGDLVSQAEADELKAEGNEDFNAGYYMVKDERFDAPEGSHLEHFRIAPQNEIIALMVAEQGITPEEALKELEEAPGIDSGSALRLDPFPDEAHIYMSYGAKVKEAHRVMSDAGQMPFTGGRQTVMIISPDVIDFGPALVEELNARRVSADHEIEDDTPSP